MPFGRDHERWADATGAYLLDALPADERAGFEAHAEQCEFCREEIAFLRVASDALPSAVPQVAPPPELKGRIMAVVEREAELLRAASPDAPSAAPARIPWWRRLAVTPRRPALAIAAVFVALVGVGVGALVAGTGGEPARTLAGTLEQGRGEARLVVEDGQGDLRVDGLRPAPSGRVYQVWLKRRGVEAPEPTRALFVPAPDGSAGADGLDLRDVEAVLVTDEPRGGSPAPTGELAVTVPVRS